MFTKWCINMWAVSIRIALTNVYGYSANHPVFGKNPNFLSVLHNKLLALDDTVKSEILLDNLNALHSVFQALISAESTEWIQYTLRTESSQIFFHGASMDYKSCFASMEQIWLCNSCWRPVMAKLWFAYIGSSQAVWLPKMLSGQMSLWCNG